MLLCKTEIKKIHNFFDVLFSQKKFPIQKSLSKITLMLKASLYSAFRLLFISIYLTNAPKFMVFLHVNTCASPQSPCRSSCRKPSTSDAFSLSGQKHFERLQCMKQTAQNKITATPSLTDGLARYLFEQRCTWHHVNTLTSSFRRFLIRAEKQHLATQRERVGNRTYF